MRTMITTRCIQVSMLGWVLTMACQSARPNAVPLSRSQIQGDTSRPVLPDQPNLPGDSTFTVEAPPYARSALLYYRNIVGVTFHGSTGGETIRAILRKYGGVIIGGVPGPAGDPEYIIQVPDPGLTLAAVDSLVSEIAREPGVKRTAKVHFRTPLRLKSRHATDRPGS